MTSSAWTTTCGRDFSARRRPPRAPAPELEKSLKNYRHEDVDIRDNDAVNALFARLGSSIKVVVHTAAQPSHDWAAREPHTDFTVNAVGTLNLLEAARQSLPGGGLHFHQHEQGLWRHAEPPAAPRTGKALGD